MALSGWRLPSSRRRAASTRALDEFARRDAGGLREMAREAASAHAGDGGQPGHAVVVAGVFHHMGLYPRDRRARILWRAQVGAELRLPALPLGHHHQLLRDAQRQFRAMVLGHQRQGVDAGGYAGRGDQRAAAHMDAVRLDPRGGKAGRQLIGEFPMRGDGMTVQQPGVAEREGAGADRSMHACAWAGPPQPAAQGGVVRGVAARRQHHVVAFVGVRAAQVSMRDPLDRRTGPSCGDTSSRR